jgi:uncharacterized membrane protein YgcG
MIDLAVTFLLVVIGWIFIEAAKASAIEKDRREVAWYIRDRCAQEGQAALGCALAAEIAGKEGITGGGDGEVPRGGSGPSLMGGGA